MIRTQHTKHQKVHHNSAKHDILYKNVLESLVYTIMCKYKDPPADVPYIIRTQHTKHQKLHHNSAKHNILFFFECIGVFGLYYTMELVTYDTYYTTV